MFDREVKFQLQTIPLEYKTLFSIKTGFFQLIWNADRKAVQILVGDIKVSLKLVIGFSFLFLMAVCYSLYIFSADLCHIHFVIYSDEHIYGNKIIFREFKNFPNEKFWNESCTIFLSDLLSYFHRIQ